MNIQLGNALFMVDNIFLGAFKNVYKVEEQKIYFLTM